MTSTFHYPPLGSTTFKNNRDIGVQTSPKCKSQKCQKSSHVGAHKTQTVEANRGKFVGVKDNLCGFETASSIPKFDQ